jgi:hypothetical protein
LRQTQTAIGKLDKLTEIVAFLNRIARLVGNTSGLCVTSGAAHAPPASDQDELIRDPIIHEFIRHGYISALQHWDDIASAVRQSQQYTGRKIPAIWVRKEQKASVNRFRCQTGMAHL